MQTELQSLIDSLAEKGLFIVPQGELESWLPILMNGQSREDKSKWAMLAAEKIENVGERSEDVWLFIRKVYNHILNQCRG